MVVSARRGCGRLRRPSAVAGLRPALPYAGPLRAPRPQGDSFYGERVTRKPAKGASPLAIPLRYPPPPREKVSLRSPLSDGDNASSGTGVPIQEVTTEGRSPPWVLIDMSPGCQQSRPPQGVTTGSPASIYHQYSSKYSAGTCLTKGRQGVCLLPPFPFGGDSNIFERLAEKMLCPYCEPQRSVSRPTARQGGS